MTNREKYGEKILDILESGDNWAVTKDYHIVRCGSLKCNECLYGATDCIKEQGKWLKQEYEEPQVYWSKVEVDTPVLVRDSDVFEWERGYFAKYDNGKVYTFCSGMTSWSADNSSCVSAWKYAKLWEEGMDE